MVLGKAAEKASQTNFFLPFNESPGHKPKVLLVLRLNISPKRTSAFRPYNHTLLLGSLEYFCLGLRVGAVLLWALQCLHHGRRSCKGWAMPCAFLVPLSREKGLSVCRINKVLWAESHWLVKKEEKRGNKGETINVCLFNLSLHVLTSSFFLGKHMGRGERMQHEVLSGDIMAGALAAAPGTSWHLPVELREEEWFSYGHVSFERENQAGNWGVKGEWGWQRELCPWSWRARSPTPSCWCGHRLQCSASPALKSLLVPALQLVLSIGTALGPALLSQQLPLWRDKQKKEAWVYWSVRGCHNKQCLFFLLSDNDKLDYQVRVFSE